MATVSVQNSCMSVWVWILFWFPIYLQDHIQLVDIHIRTYTYILEEVLVSSVHASPKTNEKKKSQNSPRPSGSLMRACLPVCHVQMPPTKCLPPGDPAMPQFRPPQTSCTGCPLDSHLISSHLAHKIRPRERGRKEKCHLHKCTV